MVNIRRDQLPQEEQDFLEEYDRIAREEDKNEKEFEDMIKNNEDSFGEKVFSFFTSGLRGRPRSLNKFLKKNPDLNIVEVRICRAPVKKYIQYAMNLITNGKIDEAKKTYNYDHIFHLYAILIFDNGKRYHIEKNEIVIMNEITPAQNIKNNTDCLDRIVGNKNFKKLIEESESSYKNFYFYSAHRDNCQAFIRHISKHLGVKNRTTTRFIMQYGAKDILEGDGARNFSLNVTTMANAFRRAFHQD